nr:MAG TPA: hypothetical protein [Caudoviricetes sp.]
MHYLYLVYYYLFVCKVLLCQAILNYNQYLKLNILLISC